MQRGLSVIEVSRELGVSAPTVRRWLDVGLLRGYRLPPGPKQPYGLRRVALPEVQRFRREWLTASTPTLVPAEPG